MKTLLTLLFSFTLASSSLAGVSSLMMSYGPAAATPSPSPTPSPTETPSPTPAGPILVQQKTGSINSPTLTITMDSATTAGNTLFVCIVYSPIFGNTVTDITDGIRTDFTQEVDSPGTGVASTIWRDGSNHGDTGPITITQSGGGQITATIFEFSGLIDSAAEDINSNTGLAGTAVTTNSITPVSDNNLVIACGGWVANDYSSGPTNSFIRLTPSGASGAWLEGAYKFQSSATSASTGWTLTTGINWAASIAVFGAE